MGKHTVDVPHVSLGHLQWKHPSSLPWQCFWGLRTGAGKMSHHLTLQDQPLDLHSSALPPHCERPERNLQMHANLWSVPFVCDGTNIFHLMLEFSHCIAQVESQRAPTWYWDLPTGLLALLGVLLGSRPRLIPSVQRKQSLSHSLREKGTLPRGTGAKIAPLPCENHVRELRTVFTRRSWAKVVSNLTVRHSC